MNSLDPRVSRLPLIGEEGKIIPKAPLDQFGTYEVFVQPKKGKPFQHEGIVHAPSLELAYVLAKETFTRRFTCVSLYVVDTRDVLVTPTTDGNQNVYDLIEEVNEGVEKLYEIYQLNKRGKPLYYFQINFWLCLERLLPNQPLHCLLEYVVYPVC